MKLSRQLAEHELGWWQAHHRKDKERLLLEMQQLFELQFKILAEQARRAAEYRVQAAIEHDVAEKHEDAGNQVEADKHWNVVKNLLAKHFAVLVKEGFDG